MSESKSLTQVHPIVKHIDVEVSTKKPLMQIPHVPKLMVILKCFLGINWEKRSKWLFPKLVLF